MTTLPEALPDSPTVLAFIEAIPAEDTYERAIITCAVNRAATGRDAPRVADLVDYLVCDTRTVYKKLHALRDRGVMELHESGAWLLRPEPEQFGLCLDTHQGEYGQTMPADWIPQPRKPKSIPKVVPDPFPDFLDGRWTGTRDDWQHSCPRPLVNVVYRLFDDDGRLLYIGSTGNVFGRFDGHKRKPWARYVARECADREAAYWLEAAAITDEAPALNVQDYVGGRVNALRKAGRGVTR